MTRLFTVAIVTRNNSSLLRDALDSICSQTCLPGSVIVVDNASTDATPSVCKKFMKQINLSHVICKQKGVNFARNAAIAACKTDFLVFIDDDAIADKDWLAYIAARFRDIPYIDAVQGVKDNFYRDSFFATLIQYASRDLSMLRDRKGSVVLSANIIDTCNLAFRVRPVREHHLSFDTSLLKGGDRHFGFQMLNAGMDISFCENAIVHHRWPRTLKAFFIMRWRAGIAAASLQTKLGKQFFANKISAELLPAFKLMLHRTQKFGFPGTFFFAVLLFAGKCTTFAGKVFQSSGLESGRSTLPDLGKST